MEPRPRPSLQHRIEYLLLRAVGAVVGRLPRRPADALASLLAALAFDGLRIRRRVTLDNLRHAFPEWSERQRRRVGRAAYRNLALVGMESLRALRLEPARLIARVDLDAGSEQLYRDLMAAGRGVIFVSGHYGNWELIAARTAAVGYPSAVIVQEQRNPLFNAALERVRRRLGFNAVEREGALRSMLRILHQGGAAMILADQDAGPHDPLYIPFFGRPAATYQGPALLAVRTGAPLVGGWIHREKDRYRASYQRLDEAALAGLGPEADEGTRVARLTAAYVAWLERMIRTDPGQYLWLHRRWKSRPPGEAA
jgi:KDO2-lipid IV(A) lauroyltransferase